MKQLLLLLITLTLFGNVSGQKIEFSASLNSGLFSFKGGEAVRTTFLMTGPNSTEYAQIGNSFGTRGGLCYGTSLNIKSVFNNKYFGGVDFGYEMLCSKSDITEVYEYTPTASGRTIVTHSIKGNSFNNNSFINTYPFIGYRYRHKKINFDITAGMDIGYFLNTWESGNAKKPDGTNYDITFQTVYKGMDVDFRPRFQLLTTYKKVGVYFGYAYGISNYDTRHPYEVRTSKVIRFGVTYKLSAIK